MFHNMRKREFLFEALKDLGNQHKLQKMQHSTECLCTSEYRKHYNEVRTTLTQSILCREPLSLSIPLCNVICASTTEQTTTTKLNIFVNYTTTNYTLCMYFHWLSPMIY